MKTVFDPDTKIWRGIGYEKELNESMGLGEFILEKLSKHLDRVIQINDDNGVQVTGGEMRERGIRVAQNLERLGYRQHDVIAVVARNNHNLTPVVLGCFLLGTPVNTLDPIFEKADIMHMFKLTKPKAVVCEEDKLLVVKEALAEMDLQAEIFVFTDNNDLIGASSVHKLLLETGAEDTYKPPYLGPASKTNAAILCSSGTTGLSKGVILSHGQLILKFTLMWPVTPDDVILTYNSVYWLSGFHFMVLGLQEACVRICTTAEFTPELFFQMVEKYKVTYILTSTFVLGRVLNHPGIETANFSSVQKYLSGGTMVPEHFRVSMNKYLPNGIVCVGYGMTECSGIFSINDGLEGACSVGCLVPKMEVMVVDVDDPTVKLGINEDGEIMFRTSLPFLGYYGNEAASEAIRMGDWLHTGDVGHFDERGYLYLVDRKKDIMKYLGYQISPSEIENLVTSIPGVLMVSVVGIPDPKVADLPAALVVRAAGSSITTDEILEKVKNEMSDYKQLRGGVYFVDELPLTPSGKIIRQKVKEHACKLFNNRMA